MNKTFPVALLALASALPSFAMNHLIFLGTYTRNGSQGIYAVQLDDATGSLSAPQLVAETPNPTWVTLSPDKKFLYTIHPTAAQAIGFRVDADSGKLTPLAPPPTSP